jgi:DNA-binding CsgD family transcriptional regulator
MSVSTSNEQGGAVENSHGPVRRSGLRGREEECAVLDDLVSAIRHSGSRPLLLQGEAGIGKTALLEHLVASASDLTVVRAAAVELEMKMDYAGLQQLCGPLLDRLEMIPALQRQALEVVFGLSAGEPPDRFLLGLAVLSLFAAAAEQRPLLCIVDDAQWLDETSALTLAFVARRLLAEPVGIVFAAREAGVAFRDVPVLEIDGVEDSDARALLSAVVPFKMDERVRDQIVAETRGNPLALLELPRGLTAAQLAGGFGLLSGEALAGRIEESFARRLDPLSDESRRLLLVAAAEPLGDPMLLWRACERLSIPPEAADAAILERLLTIGHRVTFRHPLVRSAVYKAAAVADRRAVHLALAEATDRDVDPDRHAWHRGQATSGPDEEVAAALERSAARAQARGGLAAGAAFLERAAGLTLDPALRTQRALAAARAKFEAAAPDAAFELLATAEMGPLDELQRARLERLRAQIVRSGGTKRVPGLTIGPEAPGLLVDAAKRLEPLDAELARETYVEAMTAAMWDPKDSDCGARQAAEAARAAPPGPRPPSLIDLLLDGLTARFTQPYEAALPPLRRALDALAGPDGRGDDEVRWLWFACPVTPEPLAPEVWDDQTWRELATRAVRLARDAGSLAVLPNALTALATMHVLAGEFTAASALMEEAYEICEATGNISLKYPSFMLAAWRGEAAAFSAIEAGIQDANARGHQRTLRFTHCMTAVLFNGLGRYREALAAAQRACDREDLGLFGWALSELVEAAVRGHSREVASDALDRLAQRTSASGTEWALGIEARSRALLSEHELAERLYREAIERLARTQIRVQLARAHLVYGEWLRRENRRADAREQLHAAHEMCATIGMEAFAERARGELLATGEKVRKRAVETRDALTAQEWQIARLACDGRSNPEIAARLFVSPRTVEWHLRNVFNKLDIRSRRELVSALPRSASAPVLG